tara:strand:- start:736 stop:1359 length:624 start_codon:yes stop_codon:yes gene_type:complete
MANFARGKNAKAISDRSGMAFPYNEMVKEWNGAFVHFSEFEEKHPQLQPRARINDPQGLKNARPARTENPSLRLLELNPFETRVAGSGDINVFEPGHDRTTGDTVRFYGPATTGTGTNPPTDTTTLVRSYGLPLSFDGVTGANLGRAAGYTITLGRKDASGNIKTTPADEDTRTNFYHFTVATNTATTGSINGGGDLISSGPVTLVS